MWSKLAFLLITLAALSGCGRALHFRQLSVLGAATDAKTQSTRVSVTFEVWNDDEQLTNLSREAFVVYEDGQPSTSEALNEADTSERRVPVVLLLDISLSMYQANAVPELKKAAARFQDELTKNGFQVTTYRFASQIQPVHDIEALPDAFDEEGGERWTSLYAALNQTFSSHPDAIVVAFSDGADNYSQNHGVPGLGAIEAKVLPKELGGTGEQRIVHSIGFGNVAQERDRQGVPGQNALERLARNGTFNFAQEKGAFDAVFRDVAQRIRNVYVYEYFSPNLSGEHTLVIEVRAQGRTARSKLMSFSAGGSGSSLRATLDGSGRLTWTGPAAAVQSAVALTDRCTLAEAAVAAEPACIALVELARSTGHAETIGGVRTFMLGTVCLRFPISSCSGNGTSPDNPKTPLGPSCDALVHVVNCLLAKGTPQHAELQETARKINKLLASMSAEAEPMCATLLDELQPSAEEHGCPIGSGGIGAALGVDGAGARITDVIDAGGAEAAGLRSGDVITAIDGAPIANQSLAKVVAKLRGDPGSNVILTVQRADKIIEVRVTRKKLP